MSIDKPNYDYQTPSQLQLKSGEKVVDRQNSHLHEDVKRLLPEILLMIDTQNKEFLKLTVNLGRIVGESICVKTFPEDKIIFAQRKGRAGLTRFVKDRSAEPCSEVTIILKKAYEKNTYILITAFIGGNPEPEPWDQNKTGQSETFWEKHALLWGCEEIIEGTEKIIK